MSKTASLVRAVQELQPRRVMVEVQVNGKWVWEMLALKSEQPAPAQHRQSYQSDRPVQQQPQRPTNPPPPQRQAEPMTLGRDPGNFYFTFGQFKGSRIEQLDKYELADWTEWAFEQDEPTPALEVAREQALAWLKGFGFDPNEKKNKRKRKA